MDVVTAKKLLPLTATACRTAGRLKPHNVSSDPMLEEIVQRLASHKLIPFFGAGVSAGVLNVLWKDLIDEMADIIGLPADRRADFLQVADHFVDERGSQALAELLSRKLLVDEVDEGRAWPHLFLASLNAGILYTTNQDNIFEIISQKIGRPHRVIKVLSDLAEWAPGEPLLIKYHGDLSIPETVVFSGKSYEQRMSNHNHFLNIKMRADLLAKGFLFIGYSFSDINIRKIFEELILAFGGQLPPSYLIAYRYDDRLKQVGDEFGIQVLDPRSIIPDAAEDGEAFRRALGNILDAVVRRQVNSEINHLLTPAAPLAVPVTTEFEMAAVLTAVSGADFDGGLRTYRSVLDRRRIPEPLQADAAKSFQQLCELAKNNEQLRQLAAAVFNMSLPADKAMEPIISLMVAVNRVDETRGFPPFAIIAALHGDQLIPLCAALAAVKIKEDGGRIGEAFRAHASNGWISGYEELRPQDQQFVKDCMALAWADAGEEVPPYMFSGNEMFPRKSFQKIRKELEEKYGMKLGRPIE